MITYVHSSEAPAGWDTVLNAAGCETNFLQSTFWAHLICTLDEAIPHYFRFVEDSNVLAQALFLQRWPYDRANRCKLSSESFLECYDGPVIIHTEQTEELIQHILAAASSLAESTSATSTTITFSHTSNLSSSLTVKNQFSTHKYSAKEWGTLLVDIAPPIDTVFMNISHAARKCIKKCWRLGITIDRIESYKDFHTTFMPNYNAIEKSCGRTPAYCTLPSSDDWNKYYRFFLARSGNTVLGGLGMFFFNNVATEVQSTMSLEAFEQKIPVQDLLHWELILEAKRLGCHTLDLAGFNTNPTSEKEAGIARFKNKWSGKTVVYNIFSRSPLSATTFLRNTASRVLSAIGLKSFILSFIRR